MSSMTITTDNFETEVLKSTQPVLLDFWAPWCGPCKMIGPVIDQIADEYAGQIKVGKINVDDNNALAVQHGISSIPALFVYKGGEVAVQKIGAASKHDIEALFKNLI